MNKFFILTTLLLACTACERQDKVVVSYPVTTVREVDNSAINIRDRDKNAVLPLNQSEESTDLAITQKIRQAIIADSSLSLNAKNIKIITNQGVVTLRGPVNSLQEKEKIYQKAKSLAGVIRVDNLLEITSS